MGADRAVASGFASTARGQLSGDGPRARRSRLEHVLRRAGTGLLFATFGVGSLFLATFGFPFLVVRYRGRARELAAQRLIQRAFATFVAFGTLLRLFELRWTGSDALRRGPRLVVANHPTLLDVVFLASRMPQADCIVKAEAWRNPFLRRVVEVAGYVPNSSGPEVVEACVERLRSGRSVIVFPEGTRSPHTGLHRFQRGAAHISMRSGVPMTPVVIRCNPPALKRGQPWWDVPDRKLILSLDVGPPLRAEDLAAGSSAAVPRVAREATAGLRRYFETREQHEDS